MPTEVLLIDPDNVTRTLIKYHLIRAGYVVHEVPSGEAVLQLSSSAQPRLVIADESVRFDDHCEAVQTPFTLYHSLPWVVLTALPCSQRDQSSRTYIAKPALATQLLSCIAALITSS